MVSTRATIIIIQILIFNSQLFGLDEQSWAMDWNKLIRVGNRTNSPDFGWAALPAGAYQYACEKLGNEEKKWKINKIIDYADSKMTVVCITNDKAVSVRYACSEHECSLIEGSASFPILSKVLHGRLLAVVKKEDGALAAFCSELMFLYKGPKRAVLLPSLLNKAPDITVWLKGREKDPEDVLKWSSDPGYKKGNVSGEISFNVITGNGSIESWSVVFHNDSLIITGIGVMELAGAGSFSWGLVP